MAIFFLLLLLAGCAERSSGTGDSIALERHVFAIRSDGAGEPVKLDRELLLEDREGPMPGADDPCGLDALGALEVSEQLERQFVCTMRNAAIFRKSFIARHPERAAEPLRLVFYFNGGLTSPIEVRNVAAASWREAEADGVYPIYMIWPTGGFESWWEDATRIRNGRHLNRPAYLTAGFRIFGDLLTGIGRTPEAWVSSFQEFAASGFGLGSSDFMLRPTDEEMRVVGGTITAERNLVFSDDVDASPGSAGPTTLARGPLGLAHFAMTSPFRALSTPLVVGFGQTMWENMGRRTRTSIHQVNEFPLTEVGPQERARWMRDLQDFPRGTGGFARYFQWLESCVAGRPTIDGSAKCPLDELPDKLAVAPGEANPKDLLAAARIDMIGHSMGTIVVNELLEAFPHLPYENIVFMGGATTIRDSVDALAPVLRMAPGCTHFFNLSLHPMNEARESSSDGFAVSGSMLVWVDEMFEHPKTLPDRTIGQWRNVRMVKRALPIDLQRLMLFRVFNRDAGNPPDPGNPLYHGAFNDAGVSFWRPSFWGLDEASFPPTQGCRGGLRDVPADAG
jgi:hypothetical protein